jgi:hypothetical protein
MIGQKFNPDDVFFRDLTVCLLDTLEGQIRWVNRFSDKNVEVDVPFYYSLTGDERFLLDSFQDEIVSENRFVELNTDIIPRGHVTLKNFNINSDEFANPNVWLRMVVENEVEIRKVLTKVRGIPLTVSYDLEVKVSSEIDVFKCSQAFMDTLWPYRFMYFEYNFMNIEAFISTPDNLNIEITREKDLSSDNTIKLSIPIEIQTYYPAFRKDRFNDKTYYPNQDGRSGMVDSNGHEIKGGFSDFFNKEPYDFVGGRDNKIDDSEDQFNNEYPIGSSPEDGFFQKPRRTQWFNNILKSRERNRNRYNNRNGDNLK